MFDFTDTSNNGMNASERSVLDELDQFASGVDPPTATDIDFRDATGNSDGKTAAGAQGSAHGALRMPAGISASASASAPPFGRVDPRATATATAAALATATGPASTSAHVPAPSLQSIPPIAHSRPGEAPSAQHPNQDHSMSQAAEAGSLSASAGATLGSMWQSAVGTAQAAQAKAQEAWQAKTGTRSSSGAPADAHLPHVAPAAAGTPTGGTAGGGSAGSSVTGAGPFGAGNTADGFLGHVWDRAKMLSERSVEGLGELTDMGRQSANALKNRVAEVSGGRFAAGSASPAAPEAAPPDAGSGSGSGAGAGAGAGAGGQVAMNVGDGGIPIVSAADFLRNDASMSKGTGASASGGAEARVPTSKEEQQHAAEQQWAGMWPFSVGSGGADGTNASGGQGQGPPASFPLLWKRDPTPQEAAERRARAGRFKLFAIMMLGAFFMINFSSWWYLNSTDIHEQPFAFASTFTIGSSCFIGAFAVAKGWKRYLARQLQGDAVYSTVIYCASLALIWYECSKRQYLLVYLSVLIHYAALVWITAETLPIVKKCAQSLLKIAKAMCKCVYGACSKFGQTVG